MSDQPEEETSEADELVFDEQEEDIGELPDMDGLDDLDIDNAIEPMDDMDMMAGNDGGLDELDEAASVERRDGAPENKMKRSIFGVPIEVTVTVGTAHPLVGELLTMGRDYLLQLDSSIDDPVELRVKDRVIARGELTQSDDGEGRLGIRLTEIVEMADLL